MKAINTFHPMSTHTAGYFVVAGIGLILLGVMDYMTHTEKAHTTLLLGTGFGVIWMLWAILSVKGVRWSWLGAVATTAMLLLAGVWWASLSWLAVTSGQSENGFSSVLITLMFVVSAAMLFCLLKDRKSGGVSSVRQVNTGD